jgi:hypothetical protein
LLAPDRDHDQTKVETGGCTCSPLILKAMQEARRRQGLAGVGKPEWSVKLSY